MLLLFISLESQQDGLINAADVTGTTMPLMHMWIVQTSWSRQLSLADGPDPAITENTLVHDDALLCANTLINHRKALASVTKDTKRTR